MSSTTEATTEAHYTLNQSVGLGAGLVYLMIGAAGFLVTGGLAFTATNGNELLIFEVNPAHNLAHLAIGALLVAGAVFGVRAARAMNAAVGATYLALGVFGLVVVGSYPSWNQLALDHADNGLHLLTGAVLLGFGLGRLMRSGPSVTEGSREEEVATLSQVAPAEPLGIEVRPGQLAPVSGIYECTSDGQEIELEEGKTVPPCPSGEGGSNRFRLRDPAAAR